MPLNKKIALIISLSFLYNCASAQKPSSKDSLLSINVHRLSGYLSLTSKQEKAMLGLEIRQAHKLDSALTQKMTLEKEKEWLTANLVIHDRQLKDILNDDQWIKYKEMIEARRQDFLKHAAAKKIKVEEIERNNE